MTKVNFVKSLMKEVEINLLFCISKWADGYYGRGFVTLIRFDTLGAR